MSLRIFLLYNYVGISPHLHGVAKPPAFVTLCGFKDKVLHWNSGVFENNVLRQIRAVKSKLDGCKRHTLVDYRGSSWSIAWPWRVSLQRWHPWGSPHWWKPAAFFWWYSIYPVQDEIMAHNREEFNGHHLVHWRTWGMRMTNCCSMYHETSTRNYK